MNDILNSQLKEITGEAPLTSNIHESRQGFSAIFKSEIAYLRAFKHFHGSKVRFSEDPRDDQYYIYVTGTEDFGIEGLGSDFNLEQLMKRCSQ